jgi:thymidylate synthase (FAD)
MIDVTLIDHMGTDLSVVNAARVSFGKNSDWDYTDWRDSDDYARKKVLSKGDTKLIHYLAEHKHMSPFGHAFASFHVKAPVFVARQLVKHKFLRWNEISRRYVDSEPEFYEPDVWRGRSEDKKQGSSGEINVEHSDFYVTDLGDDGTLNDAALFTYQSLLEKGVCPEQARMVLPQSTMTEWYWSGSLDAFADMCNLRCTSDTQLETRLVANQICDSMKKLFPVSWFALRLEK